MRDSFATPNHTGFDAFEIRSGQIEKKLSINREVNRNKSGKGWRKLNFQPKSVERQFLEAIALQLNLTGDSLEVFFARFDRENATKRNLTLVSFIAWNKQPFNAPQKFQDELDRICKILEENGCPIVRPDGRKRGRAPKGCSPWEQAYKWLWEFRFPEWSLYKHQSPCEQGSVHRDQPADIDALVQQVRLLARSKIKLKHGTMKMLRVSAPVPVDEIYVDLNVLEQVSRDRQFSDWCRDYQPGDRRSFHRISLGQVKQQAVPALQKVQTSTTGLLVLGKPGSGKSTFLKSLAVACIEDAEKLKTSWLKPYVPIFVSLKSFATDAQRQKQFNLLDYIYRQEFCSWGEKDFKVVETILDEGRALVLLDGLDEVIGVDQEAVIGEVSSFCDRFHKNRFLISCRTQNRHRLEGFEDVEIDDFKPDQVLRFIQHWFKVVTHNEEPANKLFEYLQANQAIAELAVTPILLNLICVVFQNRKGDLPTSRAALYQKGIQDLLEGWDEAKPVQVRRVSVLEKLTPEVIEELLADIATTLFEANNYFPEQATLEKLISKKLEISRTQAKRVLRSLEEYSGLLVERSEGFWSFSHLTFQEYFVAKWFCEQCDWQILASHITESHWREVFLLTVEIGASLDSLLKAMKLRVDQCLKEDRLLQEFLNRVHRKVSYIVPKLKSSQELARARVFYFYINKNDVLDLYSNASDSLGQKLIFNVKVTPNSNSDFALDHKLALLLYNSYCLAADPPYLSAFSYSHIIKLLLENLEGLKIYEIETDLRETLKEFEISLPYFSLETWEDFKEWTLTHGKNWANKLREALVTHRDIRHDIADLEDFQWALLQKYHDANQLLVECLNISYASHKVDWKTKKVIEETLLLPFAEIENGGFDS